MRKGRIWKTVGRIRLPEGHIWLAEGRIRPPKMCAPPPSSAVRALPSTVRTSTHAKNVGVEIYLTFEYAMSTYSINEG
jgi:hypothetical protein